MTDDLDRFIVAQQASYTDALAELQAGRKRSHWMWFIFPQLQGLGHSPTAEYYGIAGLPEAEAYLAHPLLGRRLFACCEALLGVEQLTAADILGATDALKLRSSVTLFLQVSDDPRLQAVLERFYEGQPDPLTLQRLG